MTGSVTKKRHSGTGGLTNFLAFHPLIIFSRDLNTTTVQPFNLFQNQELNPTYQKHQNVFNTFYIT